MSTETRSIKRTANPFIVILILLGAAAVLAFIWWSTSTEQPWIPIFDIAIAVLAAWVFFKEPVNSDMSLASLKTLRALNGAIVVIALTRAISSALGSDDPVTILTTGIAAIVGLLLFVPLAVKASKEYNRSRSADRDAAKSDGNRL